MPLRSRVPDVQIPEAPLHAIVDQIWKTHGDMMALVSADTGEEITYAQLRDQVRRVASGLVRRGMRPGDVLCICIRNCPQFVVLMYATLTAGGTMSPANPDYTVFELSRQLKDCGARFIFTSHDLVSHLQQASNQTGLTQNMLVLGESLGCVSYASLLSDDGSLCPTPASLNINPREHPAFIPYSSGTTGVPKGVLLTHYNVVALIMQMIAPAMRDPATPPLSPETQQVLAAFLPYFHVAGLIMYNVIFLVGGMKQVTMARYTTPSLLQVIQDYKVTYLGAVPSVVVALAKYPKLHEYDLSSVKQGLCGAAPIDKATEEEFTRKLNIQSVKQGYGMTETTGLVFLHPYWSQTSGSVGTLIPNAEVIVVDPDTGKELGVGQRGELLYRGPNVMKGYLNRPEATKNTIRPDGFLHTGDIVYYDENHMFYVVDRLKELIKYKAFQVPPAELEALLLEHPGVADAAVVGVPDVTAGELPRAYVVTQPHATLTEKDIHKFVEERAAHYKWLRGGVEFVSEIPKNPSGKILRRILRERVRKSKM